MNVIDIFSEHVQPTVSSDLNNDQAKCSGCQCLSDREWSAEHWPYQLRSYHVTLWHGNAFRITGPLRMESTGHWLISIKSISKAELWCFLFPSRNRLLNKQSNCWLVISEALMLMWRLCNIHITLITITQRTSRSACMRNMVLNTLYAL